MPQVFLNLVLSNAKPFPAEYVVLVSLSGIPKPVISALVTAVAAVT
jgi:hypothetical protein